MAGPKSLASLSPTLLARKGGARPAMRPQLLSIAQVQESTAHDWHDDLGWNDMGEGAPDQDTSDQPLTGQVTGEVVAFEPPGSSHMPRAMSAGAMTAGLPEVLRQQEAIAHRIAPAPAPATTPVERRSALAEGRRAAFTLRLDADRHLNLRLASTVTNRSAQQIVTDALDRMIADMPGIADLAATVREQR